MRRKYLFLLTPVVALSSMTLTGCGGRDAKPDVYDKDGNLLISLRNLYFSDYTETANDVYLRELQEQFKVKLSFQSYQWSNWETQVTGAINADNLTDVFHANIDSYNFASYYKFWAEEEMIKPLPNDLTKWPNIKRMLENTSNVEKLYINGKLYGLPIAKNTTDYDTFFSPFTYIYRRDWAKKWGVYQENDIYTWEQFEALLEKFKTELAPTSRYALGDVEWGYPSIVNFYKHVPHCYAYDEATQDYVNNYLTDEYILGLEKSKSFKSNGYYYPGQNSAVDGRLNIEYYSNQIGILYENLSYSNYEALKKQLKISNASLDNFNIEDATAIMKIKAPADSIHADKYVLEGTDNWFSMTFFDFLISDAKQAKILDIIDWLLSEEGTLFSVYGIEGYDYTVDPITKEIELIPEAWPEDPQTHEKAAKTNGAKMLRYMGSLGYDTLSYDPLTNKESVAYLESWEAEMKEALEHDELDVLKENKDVMWLTSNLKARYSGIMRTNALGTVMNYIYGTNRIVSIDDYKNDFKYPWAEVLAEINSLI